jgi:hypothetical protein
MKKTFLVVVILAAGGLIWWLMRPPPAAAESAPTTSAAPVPVKLAPPKSAVMAPILPPVIQPDAPATQMTAAQSAAGPKADAQADLGTAIPDLANLLATGDLTDAFENYTPPDVLAQIPPDRMAAIEQQLTNLNQQPQAMARLAVMSQVLASFNGQTPSYNDTGDVATYPIINPADGSSQGAFHFQKVGGRWYIAQTDLGRLGNALGM